MKLMKLICISIIVFGYQGSSFAAGSSGKRLIDDVNITESGFVRIQGDAAWANPDSCGSSDFIWMDPTAPTYKTMLAQVLTGLAADKLMDAWVSGCLAWAGTTYPKISALHLRRN